MAPRADETTDLETLTPEADAAVSAALDHVEAGSELEDGKAWLAGWRERLEARRARTG